MTARFFLVLGLCVVNRLVSASRGATCVLPSVRPGQHAGTCRGISYAYRIPKQCGDGGCGLLFNGHSWTNPLARKLTADSLKVGNKQQLVVFTLEEKPPAPTLSSRWIFDIGNYMYERFDGVLEQVWSSPQGPFERPGIYTTFTHTAGATSFSGSMTWPEHSYTDERGTTSDWPEDTRFFEGIIDGTAIEWQVLNTKFSGNIEGAFTVPARRITTGVANNSDTGAFKLSGAEIFEPWSGCDYSRLWSLVSAAQAGLRPPPGRLQFAGFQLDSRDTWGAVATHAANCSADG